jgi:hypothetical protein
MSYANINNPANYQLASFGQFGFRNITSGFSPVSGELYRAVTVLSDAVVTVTPSSGDSLSAITLLAGTTIYGLFSAVSVSSGRVLAYIA